MFRAKPQDVHAKPIQDGGLMIKLPNRRVCIFPTEPDGILLVFQRLGIEGSDEPRTVETLLALSWDAALAVRQCITGIELRRAAKAELDQ